METSQVTLPKGNRLVLSSSPHAQSPDSVRSIMGKVMLALTPAAAAGIYFFGMNALMVMVLCMVFSVGAEMLWFKIAGTPVRTVLDGSAALTGLLLAMNLSSEVPWYVCLIGSFLAIWLGKQVFGGLGHNPFNPALVARVGLLIALPAAMTTWGPARNMNDAASRAFFAPADLAKVEKASLPDYDGLTCATPLGIAGSTKKILGHSESALQNFRAIDNEKTRWNYFLGNRGGCLGETSALALLIGGVILIYFKLINWRVPLAFVGTAAVLTGLIHMLAPGVTPTPLFHILTGGLLLGAIFMATDMVTTPITIKGGVIFGIGCGVLTVMIRVWGNYPEGVSFSILFMNALVPLIDRMCTQRPFGYVRKRERA